ncbi:MAG: hypothetical protein OEM15_07715 [Myxococcales bacterium]|nr:hypothetical protein [Myxococcales bacterium]MDH3484696.1 hypothetical protein [Myxococcales bacterium]
MKYLLSIVAVVVIFDASAMAQEEAAVGTVTTPEASGESPAAEDPPAEDDEKSPYSKKVGGLLRIEFGAGPSAYDIGQFRNGLNLAAPSVNGPEYSLSAGVGLGGFVIGAGFRWANYSAYNLMKFGLDIQGILRFIPYVHPMLRINLYYAGTRNGSPVIGLTDVKSNGGGVTLGAGLRIPIVRWISFAFTFDWSLIGLGVSGDTTGGREKGSLIGQQLTGLFAVTFQFIGVRRGD